MLEEKLPTRKNVWHISLLISKGENINLDFFPSPLNETKMYLKYKLMWN